MQELTTICQEVTGKTIPITSVAENRAADIRLYITDNTHVTARTGWKPQLGICEIVTDIHAWLNENQGALEGILK